MENKCIHKRFYRINTKIFLYKFYFLYQFHVLYVDCSNMYSTNLTMYKKKNIYFMFIFNICFLKFDKTVYKNGWLFRVLTFSKTFFVKLIFIFNV